MKPVLVILPLAFCCCFLVVPAEPSYAEVRKTPPECDSVIYPVEWYVQKGMHAGSSLNMKDSVYWLQRPGSKNDRIIQSPVFGFDCAKPTMFSVAGKLNCRLKKDGVYRLCVEVKCSAVDSILDCVGFSVDHVDKAYTWSFPLFRMNRIDRASLKKDVWTRVEFRIVATGEETEISIGQLLHKDTRKKITGVHTLLVRDVHLEYEAQFSDLDRSNLLLNGDLEYFTQSPRAVQSGDGGMFWWQKENHRNYECISSRDTATYHDNRVDLGTPDLFTEYAGLDAAMPLPFSGKNYGLLSLYPLGTKRATAKSGYGGEYMQCELREPLMKDSTYLLSFAYMRSPGSNVATNSLGVQFTACPFSADSCNMKSIMPDGHYFVSDSVNLSAKWTMTEIVFTAKGGEKYFTVGAFRHNGKPETVKVVPVTGFGLTGYYYVDNFRLEKREHK